MNNHSIAFVTCVNDEEQYQECVRYIDKLNIPDGYEIEKIAVKEAKSITSAYNQSIVMSKSKYKVYLHQDTFIINKNFILDCLRLFKENEEVGMLGVIGAEVIPTNAIWWESKHSKGKAYESSTGKIELLNFDNNKNQEKYTEVKAIDGFIMITQYDLKWREDIFDGWHFYDISQCVEFNNAGYKVAIPNQSSPWCVHDCGLVNVENGYDEYRNRFIDKYSKDIFPLVSVVIPTYNRINYFKIALGSAINQTYKNIEIIICDDSDNEETKEFISSYLHKCDNITYMYEKGISPKKNWAKGMKACNGEYLNFLMDDDYFHPDKIRRMMDYYIQYPNVSLVTSYRQVINGSGDFLKSFPATYRLFEKDTLIDGKQMGKHILMNLLNVIGEPTTVLFRKKYYVERELYYGNDIEYDVIADVARNLKALNDGDCVYISDTLSYFRCHEGQDQNSLKAIKNGLLQWYSILMTSYEQHIILESKEDCIEAFYNWINMLKINLKFFQQSDKEFIDEILEKVCNIIKLITRLQSK